MLRKVILVVGLLVMLIPAMAQGDGGMHLEGYCAEDAQLVLTSYSGFGWRCQEVDGTLSDIDFVAVCQEQYGSERPYPLLSSVYNPFGWSCVAGISTSLMAVIPEPPAYGGGLDLAPFCQYSPEYVGSTLEVVDETASDGYICLNEAGEELEIDFQAACDWQYPFASTTHVVQNSTPWGNGCEETE